MDGALKNREITVGTLDCGMKWVHIMDRSVAEYCGVAVRAGSRNERPGEEGLAHFVEHTIFKGTHRRPASRIINRMESVGGELNAYTTKEETYIYTVAPAGNHSRSLDLIADLVTNSRFPDAELDREREVVAEEIDSYLDTPSEAAYDDFEDRIFAGSPLGHNILGKRSTLDAFHSEQCRSFIDRYYSATNMVLYYIGSCLPSVFIKAAEKCFANMPAHEVIHDEDDVPVLASFADVRNEGNHQANAVIGARIPSLYSDERFAYSLLNNYIGGPGMNSRLNVILREKRGLVYSVDSATSLYSDCGLLTVLFGTGPDDTARCLRLIGNEIRRIAETPLSQRALDAIRRQYIGQMTVSSQSMEQTILSAARSLLFFGQVKPASATVERINGLMPDDLCRAAMALTPDRLSSYTIL